MLDFFVPLLVPFVRSSLALLLGPSLEFLIGPFFDPLTGSIFGGVLDLLRIVFTVNDFTVVPLSIINVILSLPQED